MGKFNPNLLVLSHVHTRFAGSKFSAAMYIFRWKAAFTVFWFSQNEREKSLELMIYSSIYIFFNFFI